MKKIIIILLFSALFLSVYSQDSVKFDILTTGSPIPAFDIVTENGIIPSSTLKGNTTLLVFFATWCGPCRQELPQIQNKIWKKYSSDTSFKLYVIGREHSIEEVLKFKNDNR